jgi:hypothetical protein
LLERFKVSFTFEHESLSIQASLQAIRKNIFLNIESVEEEPLGSVHTSKLMVHKLFEFYNVTEEEYDEGDHRNVQVLEM